MKKFIITNCPATFTRQDWNVNDSINGILYDTFHDALKDLISVEGFGVAEVIVKDVTVTD